jgi:ectoine hydroxylase-related dioxygenase (phytanoyl-CoA dioxygenase family)
MTTALLQTPVNALTTTQRAHYQEQGYLLLRRIFTAAEVAELSAEADRLLERTDLMVPRNLRVRFKPHVETGAPLFEVFDPFLDLAPVASRLVADRRLLDALHGIYGEEACLFKDKLIYKAPGSEGVHLHQDYIAWPRFPKSFLTVLVAIDPFDNDNGCTEVFPGCHKLGYLSAADGKHYSVDEARLNGSTPLPLLLDPGDVAIFGCLVPHRSAANRSRRWRRGLFISYNAASEGGFQKPEHYQDFHAWMRDKYPASDGGSWFFR